ncbi:14480_t:CDS:10 [Entrophospora sp. SA101]|nr:14480_t:CDS:10 [Entrophospora sp. SA101]
MPKYYCDSSSVRKAHNYGKNHNMNVKNYYAELGQDKAQAIIDEITKAYEHAGVSGQPGFPPQYGYAPGVPATGSNATTPFSGAVAATGTNSLPLSGSFMRQPPPHYQLGYPPGPPPPRPPLSSPSAIELKTLGLCECLNIFGSDIPIAAIEAYYYVFQYVTISTAHWQKYPNENCSHVVGTDVLDRYVDKETGVLKTERLMQLRNQNIPSFFNRIFGNLTETYAREISEVDPKKKVLKLTSTNLTMRNIINVSEVVTYTQDPDDPSRTIFKQEAKINCGESIHRFANHIEEFFVQRFKENSMKGRQGFEINEIRNGAHDFKVHQLPLARIKKVMKTDEDVKMISAEVSCDIFITELTTRAWLHAEECKRRTLQRSDIVNAIKKLDMFDFLIDIVPRGGSEDKLTTPNRTDDHSYEPGLPPLHQSGPQFNTNTPTNMPGDKMLIDYPHHHPHNPQNHPHHHYMQRIDSHHRSNHHLHYQQHHPEHNQPYQHPQQHYQHPPPLLPPINPAADHQLISSSTSPLPSTSLFRPASASSSSSDSAVASSSSSSYQNHPYYHHNNQYSYHHSSESNHPPHHHQHPPQPQHHHDNYHPQHNPNHVKPEYDQSNVRPPIDWYPNNNGNELHTNNNNNDDNNHSNRGDFQQRN